MYTIYADDHLLYAPNLADEGYALISPKLTTELGKAGSLEFTMPPSHILYNSLNKLKTTIKVKADGTEIWRGRVLHEEKDFYNRKAVYCEGALSFLTDTVVRPYSYSGSVTNLFKKYINDHAAQASDGRKFTFGSCTVTDPNDYIVRSNSDYVSTLDEMNEKLPGLMGGYFRVGFGSGDAMSLSYVTDYGGISDQVIEFGVNLLDIMEYVNAEDVFTVLVPLGARVIQEDGTEGPRLTIASLYQDGRDYIENSTAIGLFGRIVRTNVWDDVTVASNLRTKGQAFLDAGVEMAVTLSIRAVDLNLLDVNTGRIKLGDYIRVISLPHGLDRYFLCSKIVLDMESPDQTEYTLGVGYSAMTDRQVASQKQSRDAYAIAENASSTASGASTQVAEFTGNYVDKVTFLNFQAGVNEKLTAVCHYKGTVSSYSSLPTSGRAVGDTYNVADTGANYSWSGSSWDKLSETVDLSSYALRSEIPTDYIDTETFQALADRVTALEEAGTKPDEPEPEQGE